MVRRRPDIDKAVGLVDEYLLFIDVPEHRTRAIMKTSFAALLGILSSSAQAENVGFIVLVDCEQRGRREELEISSQVQVALIS